MPPGEDLASGRVVLGYMHNFEVTAAFAESVFQTFAYEAAANTDRLAHSISVSAAPMALDVCRNLLVKMFLDECDQEWLWCLDSDMGFLPDTLATLLVGAEEHGPGIISGLYMGRTAGEHDGKGGFHYGVRPQIYKWVEESQVFAGPDSLDDLPEGERYLDVDGVGAGCMLVRREVLQEIRTQFGDTWFDLITTSGGRMSEDLSFCMRARQCGFGIVCDTQIRLNHQKVTWI